MTRTHVERTRAVVNSYEQATGAFAQNPDDPDQQLEELLRQAVSDRYTAINSTALAVERLDNPQHGCCCSATPGSGIFRSGSRPYSAPLN